MKLLLIPRCQSPCPLLSSLPTLFSTPPSLSGCRTDHCRPQYTKTNAKIGRKRLKQAANILSLFPRALLPSPPLPLRFAIVVTYILLGFVFCNVSMFRAVFFLSVRESESKGKRKRGRKINKNAFMSVFMFIVAHKAGKRNSRGVRKQWGRRRGNTEKKEKRDGERERGKTKAERETKFRHFYGQLDKMCRSSQL